MEKYNWIPVEEKLPADTRWVWAYGPIQPEPVLAAYHAEEGVATWHVQPFKEDWYWTTQGISHWLPIEAAIKDNTAKDNALSLLKRLVEEGEPFIEDDYGNTYCFFCRTDWPNHAGDCIYTESEKLLGVTGARLEKESWYNPIQHLSDSGQLKSG